MFEAADTPALRFLMEHGAYRRAASTFPSLTPVCLASIATGAHGDLHVFYLPDYDYASHAAGPDESHAALARSDAAIAALMDAAGGPDAFLERYAVVVCSDHGQSKVERTARLDVGGDLVTASNRAA